MKQANIMRRQLLEWADPEKEKVQKRFFKTSPGSYGQGDRFVGIPVPIVRNEARKWCVIADVDDVVQLLSDPIHECRFLGLLLFALQFSKADEKRQQAIYEAYLSNTRYINNWDLVDLSAYQVVGRYLKKRNRTPLYQLARSSWLWDQRIAIIATWEYIREGDFTDTLIVADMLLQHPHDLIQKAVGWMLREVGKRDKECLTLFLDSRYKTMPRTMLRYAIEKFDPEERCHYLVK